MALLSFYLRHMYILRPWLHGFPILHLTPDYWESGTQLSGTSFNGMSWLRDARHIIGLTANHATTCLGSPAARRVTIFVIFANIRGPIYIQTNIGSPIRI